MTTLPSGEAIELHPMDPSDADALVAFHEGLSAETTCRRFFSPHPRLSQRELERFTQVDHGDREAVVATSDQRIIGVGRYDRLGGTDDAEVAFVVADAWQHHGLGQLLLDEIADRARAVGIHRLVAETLPINRPMLAVFRHAGRPMTTRLEDGVVHVTLELEP
jgi:GNAT superfamily N-acetyltransferase